MRKKLQSILLAMFLSGLGLTENSIKAQAYEDIKQIDTGDYACFCDQEKEDICIQYNGMNGQENRFILSPIHNSAKNVYYPKELKGIIFIDWRKGSLKGRFNVIKVNPYFIILKYKGVTI